VPQQLVQSKLSKLYERRIVQFHLPDKSEAHGVDFVVYAM
jgi:hypothetical protein